MRTSRFFSSMINLNNFRLFLPAIIFLSVILFSCRNNLWNNPLNNGLKEVSNASYSSTYTDINLTWSDPYDNFEAVEITCTDSTNASLPITTEVVRGEQAYLFTGLNPNTNYSINFRVRYNASNISQGIVMSANTRNMAEVMDTLKSSNFTEITVTWANPVDTFEAIEIVCTDSVNTINTTEVYPSDGTTYTVTGLYPGTTYNVNLRVRYGTGLVSQGVDVAVATLPAIVPDEVTNLAVTLLTNTSINVTWIDPTNDFSDIEIELSLGGTFIENAFVSPSTMNYIFSVPNTNATYTINVRARGDYGTFSAWTSTDINVPVPPTLEPVIITETSAVNGQIALSWQNPDGDPPFNSISITCTDTATTPNMIFNIILTPTIQNYTIYDSSIIDNKFAVNIFVADSLGNVSPTVTTYVEVSSVNNECHYIYTAEDLNAVRGGITDGIHDDWDLTDNYYLMENLDLTAEGYSDWTPIANDTDLITSGFQGNAFTGKFEGNGHTISNLTTSNISAGYAGLFGYLSSTCTINNLTLNNINLKGNWNVGGIAGVNEGIITNCNVTGNVAGIGHNIGGLIGNNGGAITNCQTNVTVTNGTVSSSFANIGGLIGYNFGNLDNCQAIGPIVLNTAFSDFIGGLVGYNSGVINGSNTTAACDINVTLTDMTGITNIGGLVGFSETTGGAITLCTTAGDVFVALTNTSAAMSISGNIGGLVGHVVDATVTDSSSSGHIRVSMDKNTALKDALRVGGLIGQNNNSTINTSDSASSIEIISVCTIGTDAEDNYIGGLIGENSGVINGCDTLVSSDITVTLTVMRGIINLGGLIGFSTGAVTACNAGNNVNATLTVDPSALSLSGNIGGLIGHSYGTIITNSSSAGTITASMQENPSSGNYLRVGGLVGQNNNGEIDSSSSTSNINILNSGNDVDYCFIGGFVGENSGIINDNTTPGTSFSSGNISVNLNLNSIASSPCIGGFVGNAGTSMGVLKNSDSSGDVTVSIAGTGSTFIHLGGFIGKTEGGMQVSGSQASGNVNLNFNGDYSSENIRVGGFIGTNLNASISDCHYVPDTGNKITIDGSNLDDIFAGGLIGINSSGSLIDSSSTGDVICSYIGGSMYSGGLIGNNSVPVTNCFATGNITGGLDTGGLIGYNTADIITSFATGVVSGNEYVGGLIGYQASSNNISYCYALGNVNGTNSVGGLIGALYEAIPVSYCYSIGNVTASSSWGGLIGGNSFSIGTNSYYNAQQVSGATNFDGNEVIPVTDMKISSTYSSWTFGTTYTWNRDDSINNGYPYLTSNPPQ